MSRLRLVNVTKRFGGVLAVDRFSADFAPGEVCGLIGPNGSGKTSLLNLISGLYPLDEGEIWLDDLRLDGRPPHAIAAAGVVRTFQIPRVFPGLTVRENLLVPIAADHRRESLRSVRPRADAVLAEVGLAELADAPASALSGGQVMLQQLAQAFLHEPLRVLLLDEPFAGVSPAVKQTMFAAIERLNRERGATVLLVSHEMSTVRALCPRVLVMQAGRPIAAGPLETVASNPAVIDAYLGQPV